MREEQGLQNTKRTSHVYGLLLRKACGLLRTAQLMRDRAGVGAPLPGALFSLEIKRNKYKVAGRLRRALLCVSAGGIPVPRHVVCGICLLQ